jgi:drug/metabolite transporter (DMT)-like permease
MTRYGLMLFAILSVLWGMPYLLIKIAVAEVSVPFLGFARAAVGGLALLPFALAQGGFGWLTSHWRPAAAFCLIELIIPWGLIAHGERAIESSTAGLLIALTPVLTVAIAKMTGSQERLGHRRLIGLALGFAGVLALALPTLGGGVFAIVEILLAAACYAAGSLIASRWLDDVPAASLTAACLIVAAVAYAAPAAMAWPAAVPTAAASLSIVGLGVFCTAVAFATFFLLLREVGAERAVVITYVAPAIAVTAGVLVLSEPLDARIVTAFALILCGSWLGTSRAPEPAAPDVATRNEGPHVLRACDPA